MRIDSFLEESARRAPEKTALVAAERRLSYRQIDESCDRLAVGLCSAGLRRGDRVAIFLENSPEAVIAVFGTLKADGAYGVINPTTKAEKIAALLNDCCAAILVTDSRRLQIVQEIASRIPSLRAVIAAGVPELVLSGVGGVQFMTLDGLLAEPAAPVAKRAIDIDLAALIYTSGSSGRPKGVMLSHRNVAAAATSITSYLENRPDDVILNVLPLSFDYGLYQVLMAFQFGGTVVLERSFAYLHTVLQTLVRERVTGFPVVPTIAALLLQLDLSAYELSSLRYISSTGAALPEDHIRRLRRLLPHVRIFSMYGLTECKRVSYLPPEELDRRPDSVGRGMPNQEAYIVDDGGRRLRSGIGELVVRGSHVMLGYWERSDDTDAVLRPGPFGERVLHTGDTFRMDDEGYLYFLARKDDVIKTRGEKVSPREIEEVLHGLDGVIEAAVVAMPDAILGQAIKAVLAVKPDAHVTEEEVLRHCGRYLEDFMVPHVVEIRDALPRTSNGKRDYQALATLPVAY